MTPLRTHGSRHTFNAQRERRLLKTGAVDGCVHPASVGNQDKDLGNWENLMEKL